MSSLSESPDSEESSAGVGAFSKFPAFLAALGVSERVAGRFAAVDGVFTLDAKRGLGDFDNNLASGPS